MAFAKTAVALAALTGLAMISRAQPATERISLPDNPCDVLPRTALESAASLIVSDVRRAPSISKIVEAQRDNAEAGPGTICVFETTSVFGEVSIAVPLKANRRAVTYWEARNRYFQTFPGSARVISALGEDAWLAGGATLTVLVRDDEYLTISVQYYQPQARELLIAIARRILDRFR
jgi:hypothetical protein